MVSNRGGGGGDEAIGDVDNSCIFFSTEYAQKVDIIRRK